MSDPETLLNAIDEAVADLTRPFGTVAVAYSGGLDSSIIAALASRHTKAACYCACVRPSYDEANVRSFAAQDGLEVVMLEMTDEDIACFARLAKVIHPEADPVCVSYTVPCLCVLERSLEKAVLIGSVADELFAGYAKYESIEDVEGRMEVDLKKALHEYMNLQSYAQKIHKSLLAPYAQDGVVRTASITPLDRKLGPRGRKLILRECARLLGLSAGERPKKAAQYSSGCFKKMQQLAEEEGRTVSEWLREA